MSLFPFDSLLALSDQDAMISLFTQLGLLIMAGIVGRFILKSRMAILLASFLGTCGAMIANMLVDGQGACFYLIYTPIIYFTAVVGRHDLRTL
jgi:uncharacterized membrane protein YeaQ/YmgE (transglycosylase-associated protein family)